MDKKRSNIVLRSPVRVPTNRNPVKRTFIKITLPGSDYGIIETVEGTAEFIAGMAANFDEDGQEDSYEIKPISMTIEEFNNLPDFTGF